MGSHIFQVQGIIEIQEVKGVCIVFAVEMVTVVPKSNCLPETDRTERNSFGSYFQCSPFFLFGLH